MANRTKSHTEVSDELQLLAGVWALVCFAVLTTAALHEERARKRAEEKCREVLDQVVRGSARHVRRRASAQTVPYRQKPAFPEINLPERSRGDRAIQLLGARLPEVAPGMESRLQSSLQSASRPLGDHRSQGACSTRRRSSLPRHRRVADLDGRLVPLDQTLKLHSKPGSKRTIYLNFVGATLTNTVWNSSASSITALPFDLDGVPYSFSTAELERIQHIWQRVAEDYAAFDVDVTTEPHRRTR